MFEQERAHLMPMPTPFDGYVERAARVSSTCLVVVGRNRYSVPCEFAGQMLSTRLYPGRVVVVGDDAVVAEHERLADEGLVRYDWQHYIPLIQRKPGALRNGAPFLDMPEPLQRLRRALLRETGGERVMAKVLALVRATPFEASPAQHTFMRRRTTTPETHTLIHNRSCFRSVSTPAQNSIGAQNSVGADREVLQQPASRKNAQKSKARLAERLMSSLRSTTSCAAATTSFMAAPTLAHSRARCSSVPRALVINASISRAALALRWARVRTSAATTCLVDAGRRRQPTLTIGE